MKMINLNSAHIQVISNLADKIWYRKFIDLDFKLKLLSIFFWPFSIIYAGVFLLRKKVIKPKNYASKFQVWVVGNSTVGGNGKSLLVTWVAQELIDYGKKIAILSKGYGVKVKVIHHLCDKSNSVEVGDEALMHFRQLKCDVIVAPNRLDGIKYIESLDKMIDIIICDDGRQDYSIKYDRIINVFSDHRFIGNGYLLPRGPLREFKKNINDADIAVIINHKRTNTNLDEPSLSIKKYYMQIKFDKIYKLDNHSKHFALFHGVSVDIVTAIADHIRFVVLVRSLGIKINSIKSFPDHYAFTANDFKHIPNNHIVLVSEKDAVKVKHNWHFNVWVLAIKLDTTVSLSRTISSWSAN